MRQVAQRGERWERRAEPERLGEMAQQGEQRGGLFVPEERLAELWVAQREQELAEAQVRAETKLLTKAKSPAARQ